MTSYTLSQNWQISKSKSSIESSILEQQQIGEQHVFWNLRTSLKSTFLWERTFSLSPHQPTLQSLLDANCRYFVEQVQPIVSQHLHSSIQLPRIRVYLPLCEEKIHNVKNKTALVTTETIVFFSMNPSFVSMYQALVSWKIQSK